MSYISAFSRAVLFASASILCACSSSGTKSGFAADTTATQEIGKFDAAVNDGLAKQYDVLAASDFEKSQSYLKEAKQDMASDHSQKQIFEDIATGRTYLDKASKKAEARAPQIEGVMTARQSAIAAGARNFPTTEKILKGIDNDLRSSSGELADVSPDKIAKLQTRYLDLQTASVVSTQTGDSDSRIKGARENGASKYAPKSLKRAEVDLKTAQNQIAANRDNPQNFQAAVTKSNDSAKLLTDVLAATQASGGTRVGEATAITLVMQNRKINGLTGDLGTANQQARTAEADASASKAATSVANDEANTANATAAAAVAETTAVTGDLANQNRKLDSANAKVSMQDSIENARKEFSKEEADVYQQGDKLLIRLKSMNFSTGRSELPASSIAILAKVKLVADGLGPQSVVVEGHTDSIGGAGQNQELSQARAQAVATYLASSGIASDKLQAVGYGYKKPLASNKSKSGRAQNRRVDVIITPEVH